MSGGVSSLYLTIGAGANHPHDYRAERQIDDQLQQEIDADQARDHIIDQRGTACLLYTSRCV